MVKVEVETVISAPIEKCFDLARSLSAHVATTSHTRERAVSDHDRDLLELGDVVTFEATHLGVRQKLSSRIVAVDRPNHFADEMTQGAFHHLRHTHHFESLPDGRTGMTDVLEFESPFGPIGGLVDRLFLRAYMKKFVTRKGLALKELAESS